MGGDNPMYFRLADIEKDPSLERGEAVVDYSWSPLAPSIYRIYENGKVPGGSGADYSPGMICRVYTLRFAWMAGFLAKDLQREYDDSEAWLDSIVEETGRQGFDSLYVVEAWGTKEIYASRGKTVIYMQYWGAEDMETVISAVADFLGKTR
jgi:hypothetical protein